MNFPVENIIYNPKWGILQGNGANNMSGFLGMGQLIRLCYTAIKWVFKFLMAGFKKGWGYFALGLLITASLLYQHPSNNVAGNIFPWFFTVLGLILSVMKTIHNKKGKVDAKEVVIETIINVVPCILIYLLYSILHKSPGSIDFNDTTVQNFTYLFIFAIAFPIIIVIGIRTDKAKKAKQKANVNALTLPIQSFVSHGIVFGRKDNAYIVKPEELDGHVLIVGGVGSGKSSCIAIPTLRRWNDSVFAIDIKGELYEKTKDYRPNIKVFNPLDENSYGYDPFFCLHTSHNPAQEARAIAQAIVPLPPDTRDPFWIESAQSIFTAAILHYSAQGLTFLDTIKQIQSTTPKALIQELCASAEPEARYCVNSLTDMEDRTLSSIMAELSRNIVYFVTDKNLVSALSRENNITPDDLEFGNDIYINIPEHLLRQWKNLLTLIVNQFLTHFEQRSETDAYPILFMLDEFPRLGKVSAILDGLATLRSKKIVICLIIQSLAQLDAIYGQNERKVISDTCAYKAILGATDADTQEYFSRLVGTYDKTVTSHGTNSEAYTGLSKGTSTNTQEMERRIIKPHEFGMLQDIVLLTPFAIPFKKPTENPRKSPEKAIVDLINPFSNNPSSSDISEITACFCRVEKAPYYLEVGK